MYFWDVSFILFLLLDRNIDELMTLTTFSAKHVIMMTTTHKGGKLQKWEYDERSRECYFREGYAMHCIHISWLIQICLTGRPKKDVQGDLPAKEDDSSDLWLIPWRCTSCDIFPLWITIVPKRRCTVEPEVFAPSDEGSALAGKYTKRLGRGWGAELFLNDNLQVHPGGIFGLSIRANSKLRLRNQSKCLKRLLNRRRKLW